ncbi:MAG: alanine/glycine:cation symporter family protein [Clostridia bacterium]|nr:alanine/glycine:cation symporter family protein [Clostridia bacterium]
MFDKIVTFLNDALYSYILIILLLLCGLYFTFKTKFVQFRLLGEQIRSVTEKPDGKGFSSFQALMVSTASRVGTGNIVGVSTALCLGGFGSVFWMWIIAIIGSASAFIESTLAQIYKKKAPDGSSYGGPAYYIEATLKNRVVSVIFVVLLIITYGVGFNMLTSYNLQSTFSSYSFYDPQTTPFIIGAILAVIIAYCLFGGGKRIIKATSLIVPIMGITYILVAVLVTLMNFTALPAIFTRIFTEAFDFNAIFGGLSGSCLMYGIKRGLFSNEAGVGSAPNASASADVSHPVKQGLVQVLSVFIDTILVCSASAFMCMSSGVQPTAELSGAPYVQKSLEATFGSFGPIFITVAMILFAFTTLLGNLFYVDQSMAYLLGRLPSETFKKVYYIIASLVIFVGSILSADLLWGLADIFMGAMALINLPVIVISSKYAIRALNDYTNQRQLGKNPTLCAKDIGISDKLDYWQ